jgi:hypothetical protein
MLLLGLVLGITFMFLRAELKERMALRDKVEAFRKEVDDYLKESNG